MCLPQPKATTFMSCAAAASGGAPARAAEQPAAGTEEGARELLSSWHAHEPGPDAAAQPDLLSMNRAAAAAGLTTSEQFRAFRDLQPRTLRRAAARTRAPASGAAKDAACTYGKPSGEPPLLPGRAARHGAARRGTARRGAPDAAWSLPRAVPQASGRPRSCAAAGRTSPPLRSS